MSIYPVHRYLIGDACCRQLFLLVPKEVRPLLVERCLKCHDDAKAKGEVKITSRDNLLKAGDRGPAVAPGKPAGQTLALRLRPAGYDAGQEDAMIELTEEQRQELARPEPIIVDPLTRETYVLVRRDVYDRWKVLLDQAAADANGAPVANMRRRVPPWKKPSAHSPTNGEKKPECTPPHR